MKKALISSVENIIDDAGNIGKRIADISNQTFEVANELFWIDCEDTINVKDYFYLNDKITKKVSNEEISSQANNSTSN